MKTKMKTIIELSTKIDRNQTRLKEGFTGIMRKINTALAGQTIATIDKKIGFTIETWKNKEDLIRKVVLNLDINIFGLEISLFIGKQDEEGSWVWNRLDEPEFATMKLVIAKMPEILAYYIVELEGMNKLVTETISVMENIMRD